MDDEGIIDSRATSPGSTVNLPRSLGFAGSRPTTRELSSRWNSVGGGGGGGGGQRGFMKDPRMFELANIRGMIVEMLAHTEKKNLVPISLNTMMDQQKKSNTTKDLDREGRFAYREVSLTQNFNSDTKSKFKR